MSNSLKQDVIRVVGKDEFIQHSKEIAQMYNDVERGIYSNIEKVLEEDTNNFYKDKLHLFNVQFSTITSTKTNLINKFVYAIDEEDAKRLVFKRYENLSVEIIGVYCQRVDIKRGMIFNA